MKVYELLNTPDKWIQHDYGQNEKGVSVPIKEACKWCLLGAICYCYPSIYEKEIVRAKLRPYMYSDDIVGWNDCIGRTYQDVLNLCITAGV